MSLNSLNDLSKVYLDTVAKVHKKVEKSEVNRWNGYLNKEEALQEKQKDTYDQVAAVIDYDRSKKGTDDATYDSMHGKKKQAKKERDYAAFERKKMKRDARGQVILGNMLRDLVLRKKVRRVRRQSMFVILNIILMNLMGRL